MESGGRKRVLIMDLVRRFVGTIAAKFCIRSQHLNGYPVTANEHGGAHSKGSRKQNSNYYQVQIRSVFVTKSGHVRVNRNGNFWSCIGGEVSRNQLSFAKCPHRGIGRELLLQQQQNCLINFQRTENYLSEHDRSSSNRG